MYPQEHSASAESYTFVQNEIVQAFLHGKLDDVDNYIHPAARYQYPVWMLLKHLCVIYGCFQAPVKFNQKVIKAIRYL